MVVGGKKAVCNMEICKGFIAGIINRWTLKELKRAFRLFFIHNFFVKFGIFRRGVVGSDNVLFSCINNIGIVLGIACVQKIFFFYINENQSITFWVAVDCDRDSNGNNSRKIVRDIRILWLTGSSFRENMNS